MSAPATRTDTPLVLLVGNPNSGKTTMFNALSGMRQRTGNYPGVTVEKASATLAMGGTTVELRDVPGLYSLNPMSADEEVARAEIAGERSPDLVVVVLDALNLERSLVLLSHVAEQDVPIVAAVTMSDLLAGGAASVDYAALAKALGVDVLPAHKQASIADFHASIKKNLGAPKRATVERFEDAGERYAWADALRRRVVREDAHAVAARQSARIDRVVTHRGFGLGIFTTIMVGMFYSIYTLAAPLMEWISAAVDALKGFVEPRLDSAPVLQSLVVDGVITGVGSVLVFLPQICILFFILALLEGSGYMARAAFLMDRLLSWSGLNGRAFIPLLSSFACAIPGIMAARVMPDTKARLATILVAPLMSCSARLPVYLLLIGAFVQPHVGPIGAGLTLFGMHALGLVVALPVAMVLNRRILKGSRLPLAMELPIYQWPRRRDVALTVYTKARSFVRTAGTIIVAMSIVIWALAYFPRAGSEADAEYARLSAERQAQVTLENFTRERQIENSFLGRMGRAIEPVFVPAGFDWRITTAILAAFPAREVVVPSLGIIFALGGEVDEESSDLRRELQRATWPDGRPLMTPLTAIGLMAFFALCCQCFGTLATIRKETGTWKWPLFAFAYMTLLAYLAAVAIHQIGSLASK